ncbi:TlpA family protein disulfide reductase [Sulfurospirillum sp. 1307]
MKTIFFIILSVLILGGCSSDSSKNETKTTNNQTKEVRVVNKVETKKDNSIALKDTNGNIIKVTPTQDGFKFNGYENKVVIVSFFATWCPPCRAEIPHLNNLQEKYKNDVKIIGILLEENKTNDEINDFIQKNAINYTISNSRSNFDLANKVGGVQSIPFMIIYDKNGNYSQHYVGAVPEEMIDIDIQRVL